jgi:hypothetical protein
MDDSTTATVPRLVLTDQHETLSRLLAELQHLMVRNPQASRAFIQAFVNEGRKFAKTPEGRIWKDRLAESQLVHRGRFIWDAYSLDMLLESASGQVPSGWLDMILAAVANSDLEMILANLVVEEVKRGTFGLA